MIETIQGVDLHLAPEINNQAKWIGQEQVLNQLLAAWVRLDETDLALCPRLTGAPGLGKTTLGMAAAAGLKQPVWMMQCTADTRPEDLIITPVLDQNQSISYHASPLLTAVIKGGVAILDEGNRMPEKSWASLAGLLDQRRSVESIIAGIRIEAHPDFRCVVTMNEDASTFDIPEYIQSRLQPQIRIPFPEEAEELEILKWNVPHAPGQLIAWTLEYLQKAHGLDLPYSIRDGVNVIRYASKLHQTQDGVDLDQCHIQAIIQILGEDALNLEQQARKHQSQFGEFPGMQLGDFFFDDSDHDLNPDGDSDQD
jgi:MoxR-like ATPase